MNTITNLSFTEKRRELNLTFGDKAFYKNREEAGYKSENQHPKNDFGFKRRQVCTITIPAFVLNYWPPILSNL